MQPSAVKKRVGILGGTFDPVHNGHLALAESALEAFSLERLILVPNTVSPLKQGFKAAAAEHRLAMLRLAVADRPRLEVSAIELERGGVSYTVDTMAELQKLHPDKELWLLVGMDSLKELHLWHRVDDLLSLCRVGTFERPGEEPPIRKVPGFSPQASLALLQNIVRGEFLDISATDIRARIAQKQSIRYLVPQSVAAYIAANGLYCAARS